jgi:hypothetical protein
MLLERRFHQRICIGAGIVGHGGRGR